MATDEYEEPDGALPRFHRSLASFATEASDSRMISESDAPTGSSKGHAVLRFLPGWIERTDGVIRAGGRIRIEYHSERLVYYRHWHTGVRFWWIRVNARFHPKVDLRTQTLAVMTPETAEMPNPLMASELLVPPGTSQLEMWFENGDSMSPGTAWDSRYGSNYFFDVVH